MDSRFKRSGSVVLVKEKKAVRIEPVGNRFVVSGKRSYVNDSPDLVMVMTMLMRRGYAQANCDGMGCFGILSEEITSDLLALV